MNLLKQCKAIPFGERSQADEDSQFPIATLKIGWPLIATNLTRSDGDTRPGPKNTASPVWLVMHLAWRTFYGLARWRWLGNHFDNLTRFNAAAIAAVTAITATIP